jgi:hypothetical protein
MAQAAGTRASVTHTNTIDSKRRSMEILLIGDIGD